MDTSLDGPRFGEGVTALRKRYIERADILLDDATFREAVQMMRRGWNDGYPNFRIRTASDINGYVPAKVFDDRLRFLTRPDRSAELAEAFNAGRYWFNAMYIACRSFFPPDDFANPLGRRQGHPADKFWCTAIAADHLRDVRSKLDECFALSEFMPRPELDAPSDRILLAMANPALASELLAGYVPVVPVFPGIAAVDVRRLGSPVAAATNQLLRHRTPLARLRELRRGGMSIENISRKLGYSIDTVKSALKRTQVRD
jgi:hypothetical protein